MGMKKNKGQKLNAPAAVAEKDRKDHDGKRIITDERFAKVHSDPRFQKPPKHKGKVAIDSRFSAMFTDERFATFSAPLDKRGKARKGSSDNALSRYYRMEEEDGRKVEEKKKKKKKKNGKVEKDNNEERRNGKSKIEEEESEDSDSDYRMEEEDGRKVEEKKKKKKNGKVEKDDNEERRNGKAKIEEEESEDSDSDLKHLESGDELKLLKSEDDDIEEEPSEDDSVDGDSSEEEVDMDSDATSSTTDSDEEGEGKLEDDDSMEVENVPVVEKETHRLAIVNMDWSEVKATDLFVVLSSFLPKGGQILSVSVYPSEFGLKRMEEEAVHGPAALFDGDEENKGEDSSNDDDDDEVDNEKLRAYERSRLRYYYAVVVCDSVATADYLYKSCDGVEFERSSNVLDLRFIPDDMEFKHPPRDQATEAPAGYEGLDFLTRALQHSNVNLSWDEDEPHRVKTLKRKFNADQLADLELKEFLASDESESEEDGDDTEDPSERKIRKGDKYRALIQSGDGSEEEEEEDEQQDMEVTFNSGLEDISKKILEKRDAKSETVWETYLRNRKEKKARKNRKYSSDDESDSSSDEASVEETNDFFEEEEPRAKKTKKADRSKKKRTDEIESMDAEKYGIATRAELELLVADDDKTENKVRGYKIKAEKGKKKKGKKEAPAEDKLPTVDLDDPRFASLLNNPLFAVDPTDPQFQRSALYHRQLSKQQGKGREELLNEEMSNINNSGSTLIKKQGKDEDEHLKTDKSTSRDKHELSMLVKSVKMKAKQVPLQTDNGKMGGSSGKKRKQDHSTKRKACKS